MADPQNTASPAADVAGTPSDAPSTSPSSFSAPAHKRKRRSSKPAGPQRPPGVNPGGLWFAPETIEKIKQMNAAAKKS